MTFSQTLSEQAVIVGALQAAALCMAADCMTTAMYADPKTVVAFAIWPALLGAVLIYGLRIHARDSGYSASWGWLGLLGLVGVAVVYCLPDRSDRRGFPIEPNQP